MAYDPWQEPPRGIRAAGAKLKFSVRKATSAKRRPPEFLILGAMKAATTALFDGIAQHPDFRGPLRKEIQYFSTERWRSKRWYLAHFPVRAPETFTGEASPYYLYHPAAPGMVASVLPDVRTISLLREPIDRAWSQYKYIAKDDDPQRFLAACRREQAMRFEPSAFDDPHHNDPVHRRETYLERSRYVPQLERWDAALPGQNLVLLFDELKQNPTETYERVFEHLGIEAFTPEPHVRNQGRSTPLPNEVRAELEPLVADDVAELRRRIPDLPW